MNFYKRGDTADVKFVFLDSATNEPMDVNSPEYRIVHYELGQEVVDVAYTAMEKVTGRIGEYLVHWNIPNNVPENETYFVYGTGIHPIDLTDTLIEDSFKVMPPEYFSGDGQGLVIRFTHPT